MYLRIEETLKVAVEGYTGDVNYLRNADNVIDITVFENDTRIKSSIPNVIGTKASADVVEKVLKNKETCFIRAIDIQGTEYCGYYIPTDNGMLFAGKPSADIKKLIMAILLITTGMAIGLVVVCAISTALIVNIITKKSSAEKPTVLTVG